MGYGEFALLGYRDGHIGASDVHDETVPADVECRIFDDGIHIIHGEVLIVEQEHEAEPIIILDHGCDLERYVLAIQILHRQSLPGQSLDDVHNLSVDGDVNGIVGAVTQELTDIYASGCCAGDRYRGYAPSDESLAGDRPCAYAEVVV